MAKMRAVQVAKAGGPLELVEREISAPGAGKVRVKVQACGVCHSDVLTKEGYWPGIQYPRVPGHEVIGVVDALGAWRVGRSVSGWAWAGMAGTADDAIRADAAISLRVSWDRRLRESVSMAAMRTT
jgi:alcohol dehydrogenase/propanol-preferring alcohol dehydrogenase